MKKLSKISLEEKLRKLDQLSNPQLDQFQGGAESAPSSVHFSLPPVTTPPPYSFSINPPGGGIVYTF